MTDRFPKAKTGNQLTPVNDKPPGSRISLDHQRTLAQEFSSKLVIAIAPQVVAHFLQMADRMVQIKEHSQEMKELSPEEREKQMEPFHVFLVQKAHYLIRNHTMMIVAGFTQDNFPDLYPKDETKPTEPDQQGASIS